MLKEKRSAYINKAKVEAALKERNMKQYQLAEAIEMNHQSLNYALNRSHRIDTFYLDKIGQVLDLAPEYLSDHPGISEDFPHNYAVHLYQSEENQPFEVISALWIQKGFNPMNIPNNVFWGLWEVIRNPIEEYVNDYRLSMKESANKNISNTLED